MICDWCKIQFAFVNSRLAQKLFPWTPGFNWGMYVKCFSSKERLQAWAHNDLNGYIFYWLCLFDSWCAFSENCCYPSPCLDTYSCCLVKLHVKTTYLTEKQWVVRSNNMWCPYPWTDLAADGSITSIPFLPWLTDDGWTGVWLLYSHDVLVLAVGSYSFHSYLGWQMVGGQGCGCYR